MQNTVFALVHTGSGLSFDGCGGYAWYFVEKPSPEDSIYRSRDLARHLDGSHINEGEMMLCDTCHNSVLPEYSDVREVDITEIENNKEKQ